MKYIKTFEIVLENPDEISLSDFINNTYWRYKNDMLDCIMKLEKYTTGKYYGADGFYYKILLLEAKGHTKISFIEQIFDLDGMREIIKVKSDVKILRPATEEEIEKFKFLEETNKYNL